MAAGAAAVPWGVLAPQLLLQSLQEGLWWEQVGWTALGSKYAKQGQQRGGCQGGTTHLESPLVSATPKSEVTCISPHQKQSALMPFFKNLKIVKHFVFLACHLSNSFCRDTPVTSQVPPWHPAPKPAPSAGAPRSCLDSQLPETQSSLNPIPVKVLAAPELLPAPSSAGFSPQLLLGPA